jgi:HK97 family phage major capsid protein
MPTIREILTRREAIRTELRSIADAHPDGTLPEPQASRWAALEAEAASLNAVEQRQATLDDMDRRSAGHPISEQRQDAQVGLFDVVRAAMGGTDRAAGLAREMSREAEIRSGRKAQGMFWGMSQPMEQRVVTTALPAGGPGSNLIGQDFRADLFIDRLRAATRVRGLGATMLTGLTGNVTIPRRKTSSAVGWVAENAPLSASDPQGDAVTLAPKHAGALTEWSRNMILQASPDVEALCRNDMALMLGEALDVAAVAGTGAGNQPTGVLNTAGIGSVPLGMNGGAITFDALADLRGAVDDANADGSGVSFLTNTKVRRAAAKVKDGQGNPLGVGVMFQGAPVAFSNLVPSNLTKGTSTGLSAVLYGNWSDLLIGVWSELDILVNPFESAAYAKGNVQIRAMMTVDIAVRHPESFAAIKDVLA